MKPAKLCFKLYKTENKKKLLISMLAEGNSRPKGKIGANRAINACFGLFSSIIKSYMARREMSRGIKN